MLHVFSLRLPKRRIERADEHDFAVFRHLIDSDCHLHGVHSDPDVWIAGVSSLNINQLQHAGTARTLNRPRLLVICHVNSRKVVWIFIVSTLQCFALATTFRKGRVKLESTVDVAASTSSILLSVIVIDWADPIDVIDAILVEEEVCAHALRLTTQVDLERVFLNHVFLPEKTKLSGTVCCADVHELFRFSPWHCNLGYRVFIELNSTKLPFRRHEPIPHFHLLTKALHRILNLTSKPVNAVTEVGLIAIFLLDVIWVELGHFLSLIISLSCPHS